MNKTIYSRCRPIHLYNPENEGLGSYDLHYINAVRKNKRFKIAKKTQEEKRFVA